MMMPGRKYSGGNGYRYGFNGKENDNEVKGEGNQQDYGFRISDPRLGRFLSVDPLSRKYADLTPYQFASNTPIWASDVDGLEARIRTIYTDSKGKTQVSIQNASDHTWAEWKATKSAMFGGFGWTDKTTGFEWTGGYNYYNYNRLKSNNSSGYNGPDGGTLTIDTRGSVVKLSFEYETGKNAPKGPKNPTVGESIKMGWEGFKMIWKDEGVTEVRNNLITGFSLILGIGELKAGIEFWKVAGVLNDVDDLLKGSENIKNKDLKTFIDAFKTITDYKGVQGTSIEALIDKKLTSKQIAQLGFDSKGVAEGLENMQKDQKEKKEEKKKSAAPATSSSN